MIHWLAHKLGLKRCPQCQTLVDYALDGLAPRQQDSVRQHLVECPSCMEQVRDFWQVREGLGLCAAQTEAPEGFNAKVLARLREHDDAAAAPPRSGAGQPASPKHLSGWPRFWMTLGPVFAGLSLLMTFVALGAVLRSGPGAAKADDEWTALSREIMQDPHAARVALSAADAQKQSSGKLVLCPGKAMAFLSAQHLSKCPQGRNYALWMKLPGQAQPVRLGRFAVEKDGSSMHVLDLDGPWRSKGHVEFMVTQDSGPQVGETWLQGSVDL